MSISDTTTVWTDVLTRQTLGTLEPLLLVPRQPAVQRLAIDTQVPTELLAMEEKVLARIRELMGLLYLPTVESPALAKG